ncbi:MAG: hypothetical protein PHS40_02795, partial [Mariniphaga sp.]|nr:hypothetical protein [Mariniphaga sp.]
HKVPAIFFLFKSLFEIYPFILFCLFFTHTAAKFPYIAMAIRVNFALSEQKTDQNISKTKSKQSLSKIH